MSDDREDLNPDTPFVPRSLPFVDRSRGADAVRAECRRLAREGAERLRAKTGGPRVEKLTDAESAALARKRIDEGKAP